MPTALVTGAGVRVGQNIALALAAAGYDIIAHAHSSKNAVCQTKKLIENEGRNCQIFLANLGCDKQIQDFVSQVRNSYNSLDLLVNNAGEFKEKSFETISFAEYDKMFALNIRAPFFLSQGLLTLLNKGNNPCIINITDAMIDRPYAKYAHYFSSKGALVALTKALANELAPYIRVNGIAPGAVAFPDDYDTAKKERILSKVPLKRAGAPNDIAQTVVFLSTKALYSTSQIIHVDGGRNTAS